jgi:hypothetical protein
MSPGLNLETPEEIDAPIKTQNPNAPEEPTKKRKYLQTCLIVRDLVLAVLSVIQGLV